MNKEKRKELQALAGALAHLKSKIESLCDDEEYKYDNLTEGLQATSMGEEMCDSIDMMREAIDKIEEAISDLEVI